MNIMQVITDYMAKSILTTAGDMLIRGAAVPERLAGGALTSVLKGQGAGVKPAFDLMPSCRVTMSINKVIASGVWRRVELDDVNFDTTSDFDTGNFRYVVSVAGTYAITINTGFELLSDGNSFSMMIKVNNVSAGGYMNITMGADDNVFLTANDILVLAVNDYVEMFCYHNYPGDRTILGGTDYRTYMALHRLS